MNGFRETVTNLWMEERTNGRMNKRDSLGLFSANRRETKKFAHHFHKILAIFRQYEPIQGSFLNLLIRQKFTFFCEKESRS